jgi:hypothetical protein
MACCDCFRIVSKAPISAGSGSLRLRVKALGEVGVSRDVVHLVDDNHLRTLLVQQREGRELDRPSLSKALATLAVTPAHDLCSMRCLAPSYSRYADAS